MWCREVFQKEKLKFLISLITSCDNRKWRRTILTLMVLPTYHYLLLIQVWRLHLLPFPKSLCDNFSYWGQKITRSEVNFTKIFEVTVDISSLYNISKNHYKCFMYKKYLWERKILKLCSFSSYNRKLSF